MASVRMSHMFAIAPTVAAEAPTSDHGETADNPKPAPSASMISDNAAATNAPPITAPHDTPEEFPSPRQLSKSGASVCSTASECPTEVACMFHLPGAAPAGP